MLPNLTTMFNITTTNSDSGSDGGSETTPKDRIDSIEATLNSALSLRKSIREDLKKKKRRAVRERNRSEQLLDGASGHQATELQTMIESKEQIISEYRDRIEGLTQQITAIQKRFPRLDVIKTDIELLSDLQEEESWQETVDGLIDALQTEDPVKGTAGSELNALLGEIDQMLEMGGADVGTNPVSHIAPEDLTDTEDHDAAADDAVEEDEAEDIGLGGVSP